MSRYIENEVEGLSSSTSTLREKDSSIDKDGLTTPVINVPSIFQVNSPNKFAMESEKQVYSVWGLPTEEVRERVKKVMKTLATEFNGPEFEPHVTIVGAVNLTQQDALNKFNSACNDLKKAYVAHSKGVSTGTCVYLLLDTTPQVVAPSDHCCRHFGYERLSPYMPHMSLLYADLTEDEKKKAQERANAVDNSLENLSFSIKRLALYKTDPEDKSLKAWEKIAEYELE